MAPTLSLRLASAASVFASLLGACSTDSGILVNVTRDESVTATIDEVSILVGTPDQRPGIYQRDPGATLDAVAIPDGRDLKDDPYRLLIRPDGETNAVIVVAIGWSGGQAIAAGSLAAPQPFLADKVVEVEIVLSTDFPGELLPTGCLKWDGGRIVPANDQDCDGDAACPMVGDPLCDCDDTNSGIGPSTPEDCLTVDIDEDCDGDPIEDTDADLDGVTRCAGDCDDGDPEVHEGKAEKCDRKDNDCDGLCDNGFDYDGDLYTTCGSFIEGATCAPAEVDCDDANGTVFPGAPELCDGADNDCNALCDDDFALDVDGDFFTPCGTIFGRCGDPLPLLADCEPEVGWAHPFATELCDGLDTNCDGLRLTQVPCYLMETTGAGECVVGTATCDDDLSDGDFFLGDCAHADGGATAPAPASLCEAYSACDSLDVLDPWQCAHDTAIPDVFVQCTVWYAVEPLPNLCPARTAPMYGAPGAFGCSWWLLGGMVQDHYTVGLSSATMPANASTLDGCAGMFNLVNKRDLLPQVDRVSMSYADQTMPTDPTGFQLIQVDLIPAETGDCSLVPGLECAMDIAIP